MARTLNNSECANECVVTAIAEVRPHNAWSAGTCVISGSKRSDLTPALNAPPHSGTTRRNRTSTKAPYFRRGNPSLCCASTPIDGIESPMRPALATSTGTKALRAPSSAASTESSVEARRSSAVARWSAASLSASITITFQTCIC
eukprot:m.460776 g.460776  ORF g.460776 m.460776 type:complete len:145 (+) comp22137_c0_seq1:2382-2816(+)